jgi:hypothetical protein
MRKLKLKYVFETQVLQAKIGRNTYTDSKQHGCSSSQSTIAEKLGG